MKLIIFLHLVFYSLQIFFTFFLISLTATCYYFVINPETRLMVALETGGVRIIYMHSEGAAPLLHAHTLRTHRLHCLTGEIKTVNV